MWNSRFDMVVFSVIFLPGDKELLLGWRRRRRKRTQKGRKGKQEWSEELTKSTKCKRKERRQGRATKAKSGALISRRQIHSIPTH